MAKDQLKKNYQAGKQPWKTIVIGGSAGALSTVLQIVQSLTLDMNVAALIVLHRKPTEDNVLLDVLTSRSKLTVRETEDKDEMEAGVVYIAPADYHVLVERDGTLTLDDSEKINYSRPSIDVSFESAAEIYGSSLVCVLLSGANADGVNGLLRAKARGAKVVIQDPETAEFTYMPRQAMDAMTPDLVLTEKNINSLFDLLK